MPMFESAELFPMGPRHLEELESSVAEARHHRNYLLVAGLGCVAAGLATSEVSLGALGGVFLGVAGAAERYRIIASTIVAVNRAAGNPVLTEDS